MCIPKVISCLIQHGVPLADRLKTLQTAGFSGLYFNSVQALGDSASQEKEKENFPPIKWFITALIYLPQV